ncbi:MAG: stage II sporulation protein M [Lachnospiraceae bacterium]|nr:stage II sporulation protein M [Lachnospiraceae bacterium]
MAISLLRQNRPASGLRIFRETEEAEQMARLLYTLFFGFFAGVLSMVLKKESLLYGTGFLDSYTLGPVKYLDPDTGKLLTTVFMQRLGEAALLIILSTTYLGSAASYFYQAWSGLAIGILTAGSVIRYGLKGILLIAGSLLPQQLILIPAFLMLCVKCCELCKIMYFRGGIGGFSGKDKGKLLIKKGLNMIVNIMLIVAGCFIEAYINPKILKLILRVF